jgi:hypothetical protein
MTIARESILLITSFTSACRKPTSYSPRVFTQEEGVVSFPDKDSQNSGEKKSWLMMVQSGYLQHPLIYADAFAPEVSSQTHTHSSW